MFNKTVPMCRMMPFMNEKISEQMQRLYKAAKELAKVEGKSAVARELNLSPQTMHHWEKGRQISAEGLLIAQQKLGCDAIWLRDGTGDMVRGGQKQISSNHLAQMLEVFLKLDDDDRVWLIGDAEGLLKVKNEPLRLTPRKKF